METKKAVDIYDLAIKIGQLKYLRMSEAVELFKGNPNGFLKRDIKRLCGPKWNEKEWGRMAQRSRRSIGSELPFFDKQKLRWFYTN